MWNSFTSPLFGVDIDVGQGFILFPILSVLYLFYIFKKGTKNLKILVLFHFL